MIITTVPATLPPGFYVYLHLVSDMDHSDDQSVFYVGLGQKRRAWSTNRNPFWKAVASKHGCSIWIVDSGLSMAEASDLERQLIAQYWVSGARLTNMTTGGEGTPNLSDDARERKRIGISKAKRGKPISDALRIAISKAHKGRIMSADHRARLSAAAKSKRSEKQKETSRKAGMLKSKAVFCVETGFKHQSTHAAVRWLKNLGHTKAITNPIRLVCQGKAGTAYGFTWKYSD